MLRFLVNFSCSLTVKKFDDVCEVHVVVQDDVPVHLHQGQCNEEDEVLGRDAGGHPDDLPYCKHILIEKLLWTHRERTAR